MSLKDLPVLSACSVGPRDTISSTPEADMIVRLVGDFAEYHEFPVLSEQTLLIRSVSNPDSEDPVSDAHKHEPWNWIIVGEVRNDAIPPPPPPPP